MNSILTIHIIGAALTGAVIVFNLAALLVGRGPARFLLLTLKSSVMFQTISGALLVIFVPGVSIAAVCYKGLGYVIVAVTLHYLVKRRLLLNQS